MNCSTEADWISRSLTAPPLVGAGEPLEPAFGVSPLGLSMIAESACNLLALDGMRPIVDFLPGKFQPVRVCSSGKIKAGCIRLLTCAKGGRWCIVSVDASAPHPPHGTCVAIKGT